jgi:hypothetical protein
MFLLSQQCQPSCLALLSSLSIALTSPGRILPACPCLSLAFLVHPGTICLACPLPSLSRVPWHYMSSLSLAFCPLPSLSRVSWHYMQPVPCLLCPESPGTTCPACPLPSLSRVSWHYMSSLSLAFYVQSLLALQV